MPVEGSVSGSCFHEKETGRRSHGLLDAAVNIFRATDRLGFYDHPDFRFCPVISKYVVMQNIEGQYVFCEQDLIWIRQEDVDADA